VYGTVDISSKELKKIQDVSPHFKENKTNGFCLFNNVAVGGSYLLNVC